MDKRATLAGAITSGLGKVVRPILGKAAKPLAVGLGVGGATAGGMALHRSYKALPNKQGTNSGYQRNVASNLRQGSLGVRNLSHADSGIAQNMYKIAQHDKVAFVSKSMVLPALFAAGIPGEAKATASKFNLKRPNMPGENPLMGSRAYKYGLNQK